MAFLRGTMTYQELVNGKLFQLLTGEVSDDFAVTAPVGERWERITSTAIGCPGDGIDNPTNINNVNIRLNFAGETDSQEAVSLTLQAKKPGDPSYSAASAQLRLQVFSNGALVSITDLIGYWISVTKDRIIMAIQGDTNHSGNMNLLYFGTFTRLYTSAQDPYPVLGMVSHQHQAEFDNGSGGTNLHQRSQICKTDLSGWFEDRDTGEHVTATASSRLSSNPNVWDNKWYLYTLYVVSSATVDSTANLGYRGKMLDIYTIASASWSNRDILTDGIDSWRLIFPFRSNTTATAQTVNGFGNSGLSYFAFKQA